MMMRNEQRSKYMAGGVTLALALALAACGTDGSNGGAEENGEAGESEEAASEDEAGGDQEPVTIQVAGAHPASAPQPQAIEWWAEEITERTDGRVEFETFWDGSLRPTDEIMPGLRDGVIGAAQMSMSYHPSDFPLSTVIGIPFDTTNTPAVMAAFNELYETNDDLRAEYEAQGVRVLSFIGVTPHITGSTEEITSLEDFSGLRIRDSGFTLAALEETGVEAVAMPIADAYESLQRDLLDGYGGILSLVADLSLYEVAPYVLDDGLGNYAVNQLAMSEETWSNLSGDDQDIVMEVSAEFPDVLMEEYAEADAAACQEILDGGGTVTALSEDEKERWEDMVLDDLIARWVEEAADSGAPDPEAFYEDYLAALDGAVDELGPWESTTESCLAEQE